MRTGGGRKAGENFHRFLERRPVQFMILSIIAILILARPYMIVARQMGNNKKKVLDLNAERIRTVFNKAQKQNLREIEKIRKLTLYRKIIQENLPAAPIQNRLFTFVWTLPHSLALITVIANLLSVFDFFGRLA